MKRPSRLSARLMRSAVGQACLAPNLRFRVTRYRVETPVWRDRPPLRIGIISDLHWGYRPVTPVLLARVKARLQAVSPDLILFLGDLAEGQGQAAKAANLEEGAARLGDLTAPFGQYAVLGNHDWHDDPAAQARRGGPVAATGFLEAAGFTVLENNACRLQSNEAWLAGLASTQAFKGQKGQTRRLGADDLDATLRDAPGDDPVILMAHEPDIFPEIRDPRVVLTLSGHMHGGQIRPFGRAIYAPSRHGTRYDYGRFDAEGRVLIVSGGLGCSTVPLRVGVMPEITVVDLSGPLSA